jgi:hypothetical protein
MWLLALCLRVVLPGYIVRYDCSVFSDRERHRVAVICASVPCEAIEVVPSVQLVPKRIFHLDSGIVLRHHVVLRCISDQLAVYPNERRKNRVAVAVITNLHNQPVPGSKRFVTVSNLICGQRPIVDAYFVDYAVWAAVVPL